MPREPLSSEHREGEKTVSESRIGSSRLKD